MNGTRIPQGGFIRLPGFPGSSRFILWRLLAKVQSQFLENGENGYSLQQDENDWLFWLILVSWGFYPPRNVS
jgi:hypothetical protein